MWEREGLESATTTGGLGAGVDLGLGLGSMLGTLTFHINAQLNSDVARGAGR